MPVSLVTTRMDGDAADAHHSKAAKNKNARITDLTHLVCPDKADGATDRFPIGALSRRLKLDVSF
jgi:hypothetical protein